MRNSVVQTIVDKAKTDESIVLLTGDLGSNCLEIFENAYPKRYFNCGIAEQNMLSMASGLAMEGKKVFIYSIGNFNTLRVLEQIRNDVSYMNLDVNIISVGAGMEYGQLGFSHYATEDIACMRTMPNFTVMNPATKYEAVECAKKMLATKTPCYLALNKKGVEVEDTKISGNPRLIKDGKGIAIFSSGAILKEALEVSSIFEKSGINMAVYSMPIVKPLDSKNILNILSKYDYVFTLEEQTVIGGLGSALAEILAPVKGKKPPLHMFGLNDEYISTVGNRDYLRKEYKIDAKSIASKIKKIF
ncbi:MAG: transketolase [Clostridia bacterium]|nr:transketolase [Clostridia bacterium]